jgi:hypothetical protein
MRGLGGLEAGTARRISPRKIRFVRESRNGIGEKNRRELIERFAVSSAGRNKQTGAGWDVPAQLLDVTSQRLH